MSVWADKALAALGGAAGLTVVQHYADGHWLIGNLGVVLLAFVVWLVWPQRAYGYEVSGRMSSAYRDGLTDQLRAIYGQEPVGFQAHYLPPGAWDPWGTPVHWCLHASDHAAHLWHMNGPEYAPSLCMGHPCDDPGRHLS